MKLVLDFPQFNILSLLASGNFTQKISNGKITVNLSESEIETLKSILERVENAK